jgi:DNA-binding MarR family transcriptional regulator
MASNELLPLIIADVYELAGALRRRGDEIAQTAGQTQARWQVLSAASDPGRSVPQIARRLGVTRQNVQRIADGLVSQGLAQFSANPDHRTSQYLQLSQTGRAALRKLTRAASVRNMELAALLKGIDLGNLRKDLHTLLAAICNSQEDKGENADDDTNRSF